MIKEFANVDINYFKEIEDKIYKKISLTEDEINYYLSYLVYCVRRTISNGDNFLQYKCDLSQSILCHYFNDLGVTNYPNMTLSSITDYIVGHSFVVATFKVCDKDINYLIDPTYIQFFKSENCTSNNFIIHSGFVIKTPDPGYYIKPEDRDLINNFNYLGYGQLTDKLAEVYGNSFLNTKTMATDLEFKEIDGFVYINSFLKGHEKLSMTKEELADKGYLLDNFCKKDKSL